MNRGGDRQEEGDDEVNVMIEGEGRETNANERNDVADEESDAVSQKVGP